LRYFEIDNRIFNQILREGWKRHPFLISEAGEGIKKDIANSPTEATAKVTPK